MYISEIFDSFQGEGPWAGTASLFIRTSGCNLRCWFCDTPYTSWDPEGEQLSLDQLRTRIDATTADHVVLTGGEPMLAPQLTELTDLCRDAEKIITIETAGTVDRSVECDLMAISPKMANSTPDDRIWGPRHEQTRHQPAVVHSLLHRYQSVLKFVVDRIQDVEEICQYLSGFPEVSPDHVWLMPQARTADELAEKNDRVQSAAVAHGFRFSPRLHIQKFGSMRGV